MASSGPPDIFNLWIDIVRNNVRNPFGCTLLILNKPKMFETIMGWYLTMMGLRKEDDETLFQDIKIVIPKSDGENVSQNRLIAELEKQGDVLNWDAEVKKQNIAFFSSSSIISSTLEANDLIEKLEALPSGIAIALLSGELYRFNGVKKGKIDSFSTWSGNNIGLAPSELIDVNHVIELVIQIYPVVLRKNIFLTIFAELDAETVEEQLKVLDKIDSIAIACFTKPDPDSVFFSKIADYVERSKIEGPEKIVDELNQQVKGPVNKIILCAYIYSLNNQLSFAWDTLKPAVELIKQTEDATLILFSSHIALAVGSISESISLLKAALTHGIDRLEDLNSAYIAADATNQRELSAGILDQLKLLFPNSKVTLQYLFENALAERNFSQAAEYANQLGDPLRAKIYLAFCAPKIDLSDALAFASTLNNTDLVFIAGASEALYRGDLDSSRLFVKEIDPRSNYIGKAIEVRTKIVAKLIQHNHEFSNELLNEICIISSYAANHPSDTDSRIEVEKLFEDEIDGPTAIAILTTILMKLLRTYYASICRLDINTLCKEQRRVFPLLTDEYTSVIKGIIEGVYKSYQNVSPYMGKRKFVLGSGDIPEELHDSITPSLVNTLLDLAQRSAFESIKSEDDLDWRTDLLNLIILACKYLHDPSSDLLAVRLISGGAVNSGLDQKARDFAETSLVVAFNQPEYVHWRLGNAWACYTDIYLRTGNPIAALRCLCFTFLCWEDSANDLELIRHIFRMATRIFRDLGHRGFALKTIYYERSLLSTEQDNDQDLAQLEEIELSIVVKEELQNKDFSALLSLLNKIDKKIIRDQQKTMEIAPLLALQANVIRSLMLANYSLPEPLLTRFHYNLSLQEESLKAKLLIVTNLSPTVENLMEAINNINAVSILRDMSYQLQALTMLAEASIHAACVSKDIHLYTLALSILSQPVLTLDASSHNSNTDIEMREMSANFTNWLISLSYSSPDNALLTDAERLTSGFVKATAQSVSELQSIDINAIQKNLNDDEVMITLACDMDNSLCRAIITKEHFSGPDVLDHATWSPDNYRSWGSLYPRVYGEWEPPRDAFPIERPSVEVVKETTKSLSIGYVGQEKQIIVSPDSSLASFPFALSPAENEFLGTKHKIATIPSPGWLIVARSNPWSGNKKAIAWLGSPKTEDFTLLYLRDRITPAFNQYNVGIIEDDTPKKLSGACLAFISSHGSTGFGDHFNTISDRVKSYSSFEFANYFTGCGCLVLFACSAGRNDTLLYSSEVVGLTSNLLRLGIKCVISSPWPLHVSVVETWLPNFLEGLFSDMTIGDASFTACQAVRERYKNPSAWAALNIYGDPKFKPLSFLEK